MNGIHEVKSSILSVSTRKVPEIERFRVFFNFSGIFVLLESDIPELYRKSGMLCHVNIRMTGEALYGFDGNSHRLHLRDVGVSTAMR